MSATSILINIGSQVGGAVRGIEAVNSALGRQMTAAEKTKASLRKMLPAALAAGGAVVTAGTVAVKAASDQQQAFGALDSVFKGQADSMKEWADAQSAIGLSAAEAGNSAVLLGSLLKNSGASAKEAAKQSQELVTLGADLAATYGGPTTDAVDALSAAFKGEFDSLEKYGVSLKASDVAARLAAKGQDKLTGKALKAAQAAAVNELIWEQSADAQGQAARESDTFAGAMGRLQAEVTNASAEIGEALLPYVTQVVDALAGFATWAKENQGTVQIIGGIILGLAGAIIALNVAMSVWTAVTTAWSIATTIATAVGGAFAAVVAVLTSPVFLVIAAIAALIAIIVLLYKNWDKVKDFLARTWEWIKNKAIQLWGALKDWFAKAWQAIKDKASEVWNSIKDYFARTWQAIRDKVQEIWNGIKDWLASKWDAIKQKAVDAFNALKDKVLDLWTRLKDGIKEKVTDLIAFVKDLPSRIVRGLGNLGRVLYDKGKDLIQGLINGIKSMGSAVLEAFYNILPGWAKSIANRLGYNPGARSGSARTMSSVPTRNLSPATATRTGGNTATFNFYGGSTEADARVVKRALEGYDVTQGRYPGAPLRVAW